MSSNNKTCNQSRLFGLLYKKIPCTAKLVGICDNRWYSNNYPTTGSKTYWTVRFYQCERCGCRWSESNYSDDQREHNALNTDRRNWSETGVLPPRTYHPKSRGVYPDTLDNVDPNHQATLNDLVEVMGIVLNRDVDLEKRYPSLKRLADQYHRELEKCRTVDILRGDDFKK